MVDMPEKISREAFVHRLERLGELPDMSVVLPCRCGSPDCLGWRLCTNYDDVESTKSTKTERVI